MNLEQWYAQCTKSKGIINCIALRWLCPITVCLPMYVYLFVFVFVRVCLCVACHLRRRSRSILHRHRPTIGEYSYSAHAVRLAFLFCIVCPFHCRRFAAALSLSLSAHLTLKTENKPPSGKKGLSARKRNNTTTISARVRTKEANEREIESKILFTHVCMFVHM